MAMAPLHNASPSYELNASSSSLVSRSLEGIDMQSASRHPSMTSKEDLPHPYTYAQVEPTAEMITAEESFPSVSGNEIRSGSSAAAEVEEEPQMVRRTQIGPQEIPDGNASHSIFENDVNSASSPHVVAITPDDVTEERRSHEMGSEARTVSSKKAYSPLSAPQDVSFENLSSVPFMNSASMTPVDAMHVAHQPSRTPSAERHEADEERDSENDKEEDENSVGDHDGDRAKKAQLAYLARERRLQRHRLPPSVQWALTKDAYYEELRVTRKNAILIGKEEQAWRAGRNGGRLSGRASCVLLLLVCLPHRQACQPEHLGHRRHAFHDGSRRHGMYLSRHSPITM